MEKIKEINVRNWHALYVNSRSEKKVLDALLAKGIQTYLPLIKTMKQWSDRKKLVELPLMSGYVFVKIMPNEKERVLQTKNVVSFVRHCGEIAKIRDREIMQLKQLIDLGYQMEAESINRVYKEGDLIKITSGALKNLEGFVLEQKEGRYIEVVLETIGQSIKVKLPQEILLPI